MLLLPSYEVDFHAGAVAATAFSPDSGFTKDVDSQQLPHPGSINFSRDDMCFG